MSPVTESEELERSWNLNYPSQVHSLKLQTMHIMHAFSLGTTWGKICVISVLCLWNSASAAESNESKVLLPSSAASHAFPPLFPIGLIIMQSHSALYLSDVTKNKLCKINFAFSQWTANRGEEKGMSCLLLRETGQPLLVITQIVDNQLWSFTWTSRSYLGILGKIWVPFFEVWELLLGFFLNKNMAISVV